MPQLTGYQSPTGLPELDEDTAGFFGNDPEIMGLLAERQKPVYGPTAASWVAEPRGVQLAPPPPPPLTPEQAAAERNLAGPMVVHNPDGTISTERTITVGIGDKFYVIPTLVNGQQLTHRDAIRTAMANRSWVGIYDTQQEADAAAEKRSAAGGAFAPPPPAPAPAQAPAPPPAQRQPQAGPPAGATRVNPAQELEEIIQLKPEGLARKRGIPIESARALYAQALVQKAANFRTQEEKAKEKLEQTRTANLSFKSQHQASSHAC